MVQSKMTQYILLRARADALAMGARTPQVEHVYLAILKVSVLTSEKIAPSSSERVSIDEEIKELRKVFEREQINTETVGVVLRSYLKKGKFSAQADAEAAVKAMLASASERAGEKLTAAAILRAILSEPTEMIRRANDGEPPEQQDENDEEEIFNAETLPGDDSEMIPQQPHESGAPPRLEQERGELYAVPGANSQSDGGSERSSSDRSSEQSPNKPGAKRGIVLPSFDPNEFSGPSLTIHNLGNGDGPISGSFDLDTERKPSGGDHGDDPDDEPKTKPQFGAEEPPEEKPEPPKKSGAPKSEGVDLGAIMAELRQKRMRGETASDGEAEPEQPEKPEPITPANEESEPKRGGVDLVAIMEELRQKRMSGDDAASGDGIPSKEPEKKPTENGRKPDKDAPPLKSTPVQPQAPIVNKPAAVQKPPEETTVIPHIKPPFSKRRFRTTEFLGSTYKGGPVSALLRYLLRISLIFAAIIGVYVLMKLFVPYPADRELYVQWLISACFTLAGYYILRAIPGLIELRYPPFGQCIKSVLSVAAIGVIVEQFTSMTPVSNGWVITLKIIAGLIGVILLNVGFGKVRTMPDTRGITREMKFWFGTLNGSPDKVFFQALLVSLIGPLMVLTAFWILKRPLNAVAAIYLFAVGWYTLFFLPSSQSQWYSENDSLCKQKDKKRMKRNQVLMTQVVLLAVPAFIFFLTLLFNWFPIPVWTIVIYSIFGFIYLVGTAASIYAVKD
ncbi:MAG: hypothetical protein ABFC31_05440 [Clostridiaceae bacterium]